MIRSARPEPSNDEPARSSLGLNRDERVGTAQNGLSQSVRWIERFVAQRPGICLGVALSAGIALGWWIKRL
jgi:hypothetical protein